MKILIKSALLAVLILGTSGCSWLFGEDGTFRDRSNDYRQARVEPPLVLPEGVESNAIDDSYAIPPISDRTTLADEFQVPTPEPLSEEVNRDSVRINTLADQRWILVNGSPGQVWPRLRGFISLNQLPLRRADAVNGILETGWLQPKPEGSLRERYRLRIEQGVQRGTSEVYVMQVDIRAGEDSWPKKSSNHERETLMTEELAQYLADSAAAASVSMLAQQAIDSSGKVTLEENDKTQPYIRLELPFARAWAATGRAIKKAGFEIDDLDRSQQVYYVKYTAEVEEEDEEGWFVSLFSWMWNWAADDSAEIAEGELYKVRVQAQDSEAVSISIEQQNGDVVEKSNAEKLLKQIKRHIA